MKKFAAILKRTFIWISITLGILIIDAYVVMWICVNGPSKLARDLFVMSVRETSAGGFLADIYCSDEEIAEIEERNKVAQTDEMTDTSIITIEKPNKENAENSQTEEKETSASGEDNAGNKEEFVEGVRFESVTGSTYRGVMMIIQDPSRVFVGAMDEYGEDKEGKTILQYIEDYGAVGGTNGGGFYDAGGRGSGGQPDGIVISQGELKYGEPDESCQVIGMTNENILVVGYMTAEKALNMGVRDAISFGPILIVNGKPANIEGTGGGLNPRTAIGQRSDGAILLLVIDGRMTSSMGANHKDLLNIMLEYGAVNAANLDGGSSTSMFYKGECKNTNASLIGMRKLPSAILIKGID